MIGCLFYNVCIRKIELMLTWQYAHCKSYSGSLLQFLVHHLTSAHKSQHPINLVTGYLLDLTINRAVKEVINYGCCERNVRLVKMVGKTFVNCFYFIFNCSWFETKDKCG